MVITGYDNQMSVMQDFDTILRLSVFDAPVVVLAGVVEGRTVVGIDVVMTGSENMIINM